MTYSHVQNFKMSLRQICFVAKDPAQSANDHEEDTWGKWRQSSLPSEISLCGLIYLWRYFLVSRSSICLRSEKSPWQAGATYDIIAWVDGVLYLFSYQVNYVSRILFMNRKGKDGALLESKMYSDSCFKTGPYKSGLTPFCIRSRMDEGNR